MNAPLPRRTAFDALLRKRVIDMKIKLDGEEFNVEIREQPVRVIQPIIDLVGQISHTEFLYSLMEVSLFFDGKAFGDMGLSIRDMTIEAMQELEPVTKVMLTTYGLQAPETEAAPDAEKKDLQPAAGASPPPSEPSLN